MAKLLEYFYLTENISMASQGGIFRFSVNDGFQDKILLASDLLEHHIRKITADNAERAGAPSIISDLRARTSGSRAEIKRQIDLLEQSIKPTLREIERTHVVMVSGSFKPFVALSNTYAKVPASSPVAINQSTPHTISFVLPQIGDFYNDVVLHIVLTGLATKESQDKVRYAAMLGHRILQSATFLVSETPIDTITSDDYNAYFQYHVPADKRVGWLRCMGQEIPIQGTLVPDPTTDQYREYRWFGEGNQTYKNSHDVVELFIPLLFWFRDLKCAFPEIIVPHGQTRIDITLAPIDDIVNYAVFAGSSVGYIPPLLTTCELYINHIFMESFIQALYISNFVFSLIRVHRRQIYKDVGVADKLLLNGLKWPIETIYAAFRPRENLDQSQNWYRSSVLTQNAIDEPVIVGGVLKSNQAIYYSETPTVDSLSLVAHDIIIYPELSSLFYGAYKPYRYGAFVTPDDPGWYMFNFSFNAGRYQPSGHFNISRARECYLRYEAPLVADHPSDAIILADCINFLINRGGSAILRFAT